MMKKFVAIIPLFILLTGCNTVNQNTNTVISNNVGSNMTNNITSNESNSTNNVNDNSSSNNVSVYSPQQPEYASSPQLKFGMHSDYVVKLNQMLAKLGYLPLSFNQDGTYKWTYQNVPQFLKDNFSPDFYSVVTQGAVMQFQYDNHLGVDGVAGQQVWKTLLENSNKNIDNKFGYSYVYISEKIPEKLTIWHNGKFVLDSLVNTGIFAAPTPTGTWPVYIRYRSQEMRGTNPDGTKYDDPGVPYVSYFYGGCAVHGFLRKSYGSPQSLGCAELPFDVAKIAWNNMTYGTLVTVTK